MENILKLLTAYQTNRSRSIKQVTDTECFPDQK